MNGDAIKTKNGVMRFYSTLKEIYKPKYIGLTVALGIAYSVVFWYLAYLQGGNAVMVSVPIYMIFLLIVSSSILMTVAAYSIKNTRRNNTKTTGAAASAGTVILGSGLCGCTTTLLPTIAIAVGISMPTVFTLASFLKNYNIEIISLLIAINVIALAYYLNKLSSPRYRIRKKVS